jgi:catechol 2,3-dioxygenase-like lactoylglutathione lyase family enzyme
MTFAKLDHVGFAVASLDRSVAWYTEFLGSPPSLRRTWDVGYMSDVVGYPDCRMECAFWNLDDGTVLELIEYLEPAPARVDMETYNVGNGHLCLVADDLEAEYERLRPIARFRSTRPVPIPYGPYEGGLVCYLRDPDGISIQLMQLPPGGSQLTKATA